MAAWAEAPPPEMTMWDFLWKTPRYRHLYRVPPVPCVSPFKDPAVSSLRHPAWITALVHSNTVPTDVVRNIDMEILDC